MFASIVLKISCWLFRPPKLKRWSILEDKKKIIIRAVEDNAFTFSSSVGDYLSTALSFNFDVDKVYWKDSILAMMRIASKSSPKIKIPLITTEGPKQKDEPWDYPERSWYLYANMLSSKYGWDLKKVENLDVNDALALIQEILVDDQLEKEFYHHLSEVSYPYNKQTKKQEYKKLPRPAWMVVRKIDKSKAPTKIAKSLLPIGNVVDLTHEIEKAHIR